MEKNPADKERRHTLRTWMNRPGRIRIDDGPAHHMQMVDISSRGAAMYCATPLRPGTPVELQFHLNMNPDTVELVLQGRVDRSHARGDSHLVRVLFVEPTLQALEAITEYIQSRLRRTA